MFPSCSHQRQAHGSLACTYWPPFRKAQEQQLEKSITGPLPDGGDTPLIPELSQLSGEGCHRRAPDPGVHARRGGNHLKGYSARLVV